MAGTGKSTVAQTVAREHQTWSRKRTEWVRVKKSQKRFTRSGDDFSSSVSDSRPDSQERDTRNGVGGRRKAYNGEQKHVILDGHVVDRQPKVLTYHIGMSAIIAQLQRTK